MRSRKQDLLPDKRAQTLPRNNLRMLLLWIITRHLLEIFDRIEDLYRENTDTPRHQERCACIFKLPSMVLFKNLLVQS